MIEPGTRVVVRYRLPEGSTRPLTDVIGELVAATPVVVIRARDGRLVEVSPDRIVAMKALGARPVSTREIRALERACADGWPGTERAWIDGWLVRFGDGFTHRANSAAPLDGPADLDSGDTLERLRTWFAERGQDLTLLLPDRLAAAPAGWTAGNEVVVMTADIADIAFPGDPVTITEAPDERWLSRCHHRGADLPDVAPAVLAAVRDGVLGFGTLTDSSEAVAITRAAVTTDPTGRRWVGLSAVEVAATHRRRGLGTSICAAMIRWGRDRDADHVYVQVESDNVGALAMYRELGLTEHHRYRYAIAPS